MPANRLSSARDLRAAFLPGRCGARQGLRYVGRLVDQFCKIKETCTRNMRRFEFGQCIALGIREMPRGIKHHKIIGAKLLCKPMG